MNVLDVDSKNLEFDFKRDWQQFTESRVKKFLECWLKKELEIIQRAMETVSPEDLGKRQGEIIQLKKMLNLVERKFCVEPLKEVIAFLEKER